MQNGKYTVSAPAVLNISVNDARALVEDGNGDAALLYLYALMKGGALDTGRAAAELGRSDRDVELAAERLRNIGLLTGAGAKKRMPEPAQELSEYSAREVVRRSRESRDFQGLLETVQSILGHTMSTPEVNKLFGIYNETDLTPEVIMLLAQFCKELSEARYGPSRRLSMTFIEKMAFEWQNNEIVTHERAEEWIRAYHERESAMGEIKRELGIRDRSFTKTEREYLSTWLAKGFGPEAIAIAADRTITNTSKLSWKYMDSIIGSWEDLGIHTPEEIEEKDPRDGHRGKREDEKPARQPRDRKKTMAELDRLLASMGAEES